MKLVVALGGNAIAIRGEPLTVEGQVGRIRVAADALARLVEAGHDLVVTHGNGPQVGFLADRSDGWPLDAIGAETDGLLGYWIERELGNRLPEHTIATLLTQVEVDPQDPAFDHPDKPVGPVLSARPQVSREAEGGAAASYVQEGSGWRRVVASPTPLGVRGRKVIEVLRSAGVLVICAGGGGIPVARTPMGRLEGVDAVVDKDRVAALLADAIDVDGLLLLTDVDAVYDDWPSLARPIREARVPILAARSFAAGSMAPKVESACRFVSGGPDRFAAIGALESALEVVRGEAGTRILPTGERARRPGGA